MNGRRRMPSAPAAEPVAVGHPGPASTLAEEPERARESLARAESVPSGIPSMMLAQGCVEPKTLRTGVSVLTLAALDLLAKRTSAR